MKINFENPPEWLTCPCFRCVAIRVSIAGKSVVPICNECGEILVTKKEGLPSIMEDCPNCS